VRDFELPKGPFDSIFHFAGDLAAQASAKDAAAGTARIIELARGSGSRSILYTSSGAVYGKIPADVSHVGENYSREAKGLNGYGEGKLASERLLSQMFRETPSIAPKIARTFAVVGPGLPLDGVYAVGNFIRDGLRGGPIRVAGDGTPTRSYLHLAEHTIWLWNILVRGTADQPYNVGSSESHSIREVAEICGRQFKVPVQIAQSPAAGAPISRYVPDTRRIETEFGLKVEMPLTEAIRRTCLSLVRDVRD
jgi:dTDP-glucose 4,6-dehydratase